MGTVSTGPCCLILQPVHTIAAHLLANAGLAAVTGTEVSAPERVVALVSRNAPVTAEVMARFPALRVIAKHGVGLDAIDVPAATSRGLPVVYTPGANALSVAEHALALILAVAKRLLPADRAVRADDFAYKFRGEFLELSGLTLGIVGLGRIGRDLARMAGLGLGMRVVAHSPSVPDELFRESGVQRIDLLELLARSDVVSLHAPARPGESPLMGASQLAAMKPGAILVNTARGSVVDEVALVEALTSGHLGGAGLDVFAEEPPRPDHPLFRLDNVVLSPHVGGSTDASLERMARGVAEQVVDVLNGRRPAHLANPEVWARP